MVVSGMRNEWVVGGHRVIVRGRRSLAEGPDHKMKMCSGIVRNARPRDGGCTGSGTRSAADARPRSPRDARGGTDNQRTDGVWVKHSQSVGLSCCKCESTVISEMIWGKKSRRAFTGTEPDCELHVSAQEAQDDGH